MKIYLAAVEALRNKERRNETQFTTKIGGETSLGPSYFVFVKLSFPVTRLMPYYYAEAGRSRPPNCVTLWIDNSNVFSFNFLLGVFELGKVMEGFFVPDFCSGIRGMLHVIVCNYSFTPLQVYINSS